MDLVIVVVHARATYGLRGHGVRVPPNHSRRGVARRLGGTLKNENPFCPAKLRPPTSRTVSAANRPVAGKFVVAYTEQTASTNGNALQKHKFVIKRDLHSSAPTLVNAISLVMCDGRCDGDDVVFVCRACASTALTELNV